MNVMVRNELEVENENLRKRIFELEETFNALRNGEVDAIIVSGIDGDKLYSLSSVETKYRIIIEEMYEGAITMTKEGLVTYCNARFAELISEPLETIVGSYFVRFLQESERQVFLGLLQSGLNNKNTGELTYILQNGQSKNLHISISPLSEENLDEVCILFTDITKLRQRENDLKDLNLTLEQQVAERTAKLSVSNQKLKSAHASSLSMIEDLLQTKDALKNTNADLLKEINVRKKINQELRESENKFKNIFESSVIGISLTTPDGKMYTNEAFRKMLGYQEDELLVLKWQEITHPEDVQSDERIFNAMLSGEYASRRWEKRYRNKNGNTVWADISVVIQKDNYRNSQSFICAIQDISVQKNSEIILKETSRRLELVLHSSNAGTWEWDCMSGTLLWSPKLFSLFGLDPHTAIASFDRWRTILHPEDLETAENRIGQALKDHSYLNSDYRVILPDGQIRWINATGEGIYDSGGNPVQMIGICTDITERKFFEQELVNAKILAEESEQRLRNYFDLGLLGMAITSVDKTWIEVNDTICNFLGYTREELVNKTWAELTYPEDIDIDYNYFNQVLNNEIEGYKIDKRYIRKNGQIIHTELAVRCVRGADNKVRYFLALINDITDRKKAEADLIESERFLRESQAVARIGSFAWDLSTGLWKSSEILDEIFGIDANYNRTLEGWSRIIHPDMRQEMYDYVLNEVIGKRLTFDKEYEIIRQNDGAECWVHGIAVLEFNPDKQPVRLLGTISDITEQRSVREKVDHLAAIVQSSEDAIIGKDLNGKITSWNKSAEKLFGYSEDEILGNSILRIIPEECWEEEEKILLNLKEGSSIQNFETVRLTKNGKRLHVSVGVSPILDSSGKVVGVSKVVRDISELIRTQEEIKKLNETLESRVMERTSQLDAANKELEAFCYSVSHDLRAPLRSVHSYTNILLEDYENSLDDEGKRFCRTISSSAIKMGNLIDDLLNFSRIGRNNLNSCIIDMRVLAKTAFSELISQNEIQQYNIKIDKLHNGFGDPSLIQIVWNNLISNSIKYSSKKYVPEISIGSSKNKEMITYFIKDNGAGFDMRYTHKLFGVFQRLHTEEEFEGNGIGLAIVKRIISKHGGEVRAEGEVGKGATIYFTLPSSGKKLREIEDFSKFTYK